MRVVAESFLYEPIMVALFLILYGRADLGALWVSLSMDRFAIHGEAKVLITIMRSLRGQPGCRT